MSFFFRPLPSLGMLRRGQGLHFLFLTRKCFGHQRPRGVPLADRHDGATEPPEPAACTAPRRPARTAPQSRPTNTHALPLRRARARLRRLHIPPAIARNARASPRSMNYFVAEAARVHVGGLLPRASPDLCAQAGHAIAQPVAVDPSLRSPGLAHALCCHRPSMRPSIPRMRTQNYTTS